MRGIPDSHHAHSMLFGLFNCRRHRLMGCHHAHPVMGVRNCRRLCLLQDLILRHRLLNPRNDPVDINWFEPVAAMAFNPSSVTLHQNVCTEFCVLLRYSDSLKSICHKITYQFPRNIWSRFHPISSRLLS